MSRFTLRIAKVPGEPHWQALQEGADGIAYSLRQLGHEASEELGHGRLIVFNAHRLPPDTVLPPGSIVYNTEQIRSNVAEEPGWQPYLELLRRSTVWDYCDTNAKILGNLGVDRCVVCPIGFYPGLQRTDPTAHEDVDVLFVGSINDRRRRVLADIARRKINVRPLFGLYGQERDRWIERSRIVLNVHFFREPIWEVFRCSYLLANKRCIVSENGGRDPVLETLACATTRYVAYDQLADECEYLLAKPRRRQDIASRGYALFSQLDQVEFVRRALEDTASRA